MLCLRWLGLMLPLGLRARTLLLALSIFSAVATAEDQGQGSGREDRGIAVYIDQDLFVPGFNQDRDYTMGLAVEFFQDKSGFLLFDDFARGFGALTGLQSDDPDVYRSYMLASVNYTPQDLSRTDPIYDDRPYASLVYLANKRVIANAAKTRAAGLEVLVGVLGLRLAHEFQTWVHSQWRSLNNSAEPENPQGWHNQISDGGEPTARIRFVDSRLLAASEGPRRWDLAGTWELNLGYQTNASIGMSGRLGKMSLEFWSLPFDPINRGNFLPSTTGDELYVWAAARGRAIGYDALLQGQFRNSAVTVNSGEMERLVVEGSVGITKSWRRVQATFALNAKSAEIERSSAARNHVWGGIYLNFRF